MFAKIHLAYYDTLFEIFGALAKFCSKRMNKNEANRDRWESRLCKCVDVREDILDIMCTLKGIA